MHNVSCTSETIVQESKCVHLGGSSYLVPVRNGADWWLRRGAMRTCIVLGLRQYIYQILGRLNKHIETAITILNFIALFEAK